MGQILIEAKHLSETLAAAGQPNVTPRAARRIRTRYHQTLDVAIHLLPDGPPPPRRHTGGWTTAQRDAWNLATRMRRDADQVLRLLDDTRVPFDNNQAERDLRMIKMCVYRPSGARSRWELEGPPRAARRVGYSTGRSGRWVSRWCAMTMGSGWGVGQGCSAKYREKFSRSSRRRRRRLMTAWSMSG